MITLLSINGCFSNRDNNVQRSLCVCLGYISFSTWNTFNTPIYVRDTFGKRFAHAGHVRSRLVIRSAYAYQNCLTLTDVWRRITTYELRMSNVFRGYSQRTSSVFAAYNPYVDIRYELYACTKMSATSRVWQRMPTHISVPRTRSERIPSVFNVYQRFCNFISYIGIRWLIRCCVTAT